MMPNHPFNPECHPGPELLYPHPTSHHDIPRADGQPPHPCSNQPCRRSDIIPSSHHVSHQLVWVRRAQKRSLRAKGTIPRQKKIRPHGSHSLSVDAPSTWDDASSGGRGGESPNALARSTYGRGKGSVIGGRRTRAPRRERSIGRQFPYVGWASIWLQAKRTEMNILSPPKDLSSLGTKSKGLYPPPSDPGPKPSLCVCLARRPATSSVTFLETHPRHTFHVTPPRAFHTSRAMNTPLAWHTHLLR